MIPERRPDKLELIFFALIMSVLNSQSAQSCFLLNVAFILMCVGLQLKASAFYVNDWSRVCIHSDLKVGTEIKHGGAYNHTVITFFFYSSWYFVVRLNFMYKSLKMCLLACIFSLKCFLSPSFVLVLLSFFCVLFCSLLIFPFSPSLFFFSTPVAQLTRSNYGGYFDVRYSQYFPNH